MQESNKVAAIIVTYNHDIKLLKRTIDSISRQVNNCIIINNGISQFNFSNISNVIIYNLGKNYGIAHAQNIGIDLAKKYNAEFVLLGDQDTVFPNDFVIQMIKVYYENNDEKVAAVTPCFYDENKKQESSIMIKKFKAIKPEKNRIYYITHAISSGTLIPLKNIDIIGKMREELFIDYVDYEWCWRAIKKGYKIISAPAIIIHHILGDKVIVIGKRKVAIRNKYRYYYIIRNGLFIIFNTDLLKLYERLQFIEQLFIKFIGVCLIENNMIKLAIKSVCDGIMGNMGEIKGFSK